jgi:predicted ATP-grasp superfamily ATP-dependent carboligase
MRSPQLVVAGLSARLMAEAAARDGYAPIALDAFGDADTRRAAVRWEPVGAEGALRIDGTRVLDALAGLPKHTGLLGFVPGSGFEGRPDLLAAAAQLLPLLGTPPEAVRRVRDPRAFFSWLAVHGIAHPEVRYSPPRLAAGWLDKDFAGTGGLHIREADAAGAGRGAGHYYQRRLDDGRPMSALFVANGHEACVLGFHELIVRPHPPRPYVYCGATGPWPLPAALDAALREVASRLAGEFGLLGLCSLDFLRCGEEGFAVLEVNPRPSASMALHAHLPLVRWHVQACRQRELPAVPPLPVMARGHEIVFLPGGVSPGANPAAALAGQPGVHDVPSGTACLDAGDPLCSVSATGADAASVHAALARRRDAVLRLVLPASEATTTERETA